MPRTSQGLRVVIRPDTGALTIVGTVGGVRIRQRAQSGDPKRAREEAILLERELIRTDHLGERRGTRLFAEAVTSYIEAAPRSDRIKAQIRRLLPALGKATLGLINQETAISLKKRLLSATASPATYAREVIVPLRAILNHAHKLGWCDVPHFVVPKTAQGRTLYLLPGEAKRLVAAAAPQLW
jgi:hypothetical protein